MTKNVTQILSRLLQVVLVLALNVCGLLIDNRQAQALGDTKDCDDVQFIFARGSGEPLHGSSETAWRAAISSKLYTSTLKYSFYELGSAPQGGYQYPAVSVSGSLDGGLNLIGAAMGGGKIFNYGASVRSGINELKTYIAKVASACPGTKFVLGGYSQGGQVVSTTLPDLNSDKIIYAATFGDPKTYLPEGYGLIPPACLGRSYSDYRAYVPNCRAYEGILGGTVPYQAGEYIGKLGVWCNKDDVMCSGYFSIKAHTAYVANGLYDNAATVISEKVSEVYPKADIFAWWQPGATLKDDVAFLIDTTGSMKSLMEKYANEAKNLASKVIARGGRIALYEYRDLRDPFKPREICGFGCSYEEFVSQLDSLQTGDGGDKTESALSGMKYLMNTLNWRTGATKSLVLLTDADYHNPDRDGTLLEDVIELSLSIDPVNIYVVTQNEIAPKYTTLTQATGGAVFDVDDVGSLALSTETILNRPVVSLPLAEYAGLVGETFTFAAKANDISGEPSGLTYDWDLNGDGDYELLNAGPTIQYRYDEEFSGYIQVKATNSAGLFSTMSAYVNVYSEVPETAKISWLAASPIISGSTTISFNTDAERTLVVVNDAVLGWLGSDRQSFEITDLDVKEIRITLIPYDQKGQRGESASVVATAKVPLAPNTGARVLLRP